jgi:serine/threonine-protein kinase
MDQESNRNLRAAQDSSEEKSFSPSEAREYAGLSESHTSKYLPVGGTIADGKYKILRLIGHGAVGEVYQVQQVLLGRFFALKILDSVHASENAVRRFQVEARAASNLDHPNLVRAIDFGLIDGCRPYLVMDYIEGQTLAHLLKSSGALPVSEAISIFVPLCQAMDYAHASGIVHRDLKPSNIVLVSPSTPGKRFIPKIVDFGIAKMELDAQALTQTGEVFGTPLYMSPEQCSGEKVSSRSDMYSLGCVLFETLTGAPPFCGANALSTMMMHKSQLPPSLRDASLGQDIPEGLEQIVAKMLEKDPANRYSSCGEVAEALSLCHASQQESREEKIGQPTRPQSQRVRRMGAVTVIAAVLILGTLLFVLYALTASKPRQQPSTANSNGLTGQATNAPEASGNAATYPVNTEKSNRAATTGGALVDHASAAKIPPNPMLPDLFQMRTESGHQHEKIEAEENGFKELVNRFCKENKQLDNNKQQTKFRVSDDFFSISDQALEQLTECPWLTELNLAGCQNVTSDGVMKVVKNLPNLRMLTIDDTNLGNELLEKLQKTYAKRPVLLQLSMCRTLINNQGLLALKSGFNLHRLYLSGNDISDAGLAGLVNLENLEALVLKSCSNIGTTGAKDLAKMPRLKTLSLQDTRISNDVVSTLMKTNLVSLDLSDTDIDSAALRQLSHLHSLKELHIRNCPGISVAAIARFRQECKCAIFDQ